MPKCLYSSEYKDEYNKRLNYFGAMTPGSKNFNFNFIFIG